MADEKKQLRPHRIAFELYAFDEQEAEECRKAIIAFIGQHAKAGRAVTAGKVAQAVARWDQNAIVRSQIINYFK